ncbi:MAG: LamG-like jellyroll fold domain-containing protein [Pirellulaceae bacterium]|nr:LamG-like jellyroll fold domain-containing protein [Pirellulaceae bacterium]
MVQAHTTYERVQFHSMILTMQRRIIICSIVFVSLISSIVVSQDTDGLRRGLTFHASFDNGFDADYSRGTKECTVKQGKTVVPAVPNDDVRITTEAGRFGSGLHFTKKSTFRPQFKDVGILNFNDKNWNATISTWLRLDPDKDLEPGYCDPVQIVGDDSKKGFIFLEWSKDETPRLFRFAIRPLFHIWNPDNVQWADIPANKRPMVQLERAPFSRDAWTHVVFSFENVNDADKKAVGRLHINGQRQGTIENWDLRIEWEASQVFLVLGASYVGYLDDLAAFNFALSDAEVHQLYSLKNGVRELYP